MKAEKDATQLVQDARKGFIKTYKFTDIQLTFFLVERMKEAKVEAESIVANYRATIEADYRTKLVKIFYGSFSIFFY